MSDGKSHSFRMESRMRLGWRMPHPTPFACADAPDVSKSKIGDSNWFKADCRLWHPAPSWWALTLTRRRRRHQATRWGRSLSPAAPPPAGSSMLYPTWSILKWNMPPAWRGNENDSGIMYARIMCGVMWTVGPPLSRANHTLTSGPPTGSVKCMVFCY